MEDKNFAERLNILRAGVLGANDGIISIAGVVIGVASATSNIWFHLDFCLVSHFLPVPFRWQVVNMSVCQRKKILKKLLSLRNKPFWTALLRQLESLYQTFLSQGDCETAAEVKVNQAFSKNPIKVLVEGKIWGGFG